MTPIFGYAILLLLRFTRKGCRSQGKVTCHTGVRRFWESGVSRSGLRCPIPPFPLSVLAAGRLSSLRSRAQGCPCLGSCKFSGTRLWVEASNLAGARKFAGRRHLPLPRDEFSQGVLGHRIYGERAMSRPLLD